MLCPPTICTDSRPLSSVRPFHDTIPMTTEICAFTCAIRSTPDMLMKRNYGSQRRSFVGLSPPVYVHAFQGGRGPKYCKHWNEPDLGLVRISLEQRLGVPAREGLWKRDVA